MEKLDSLSDNQAKSKYLEVPCAPEKLYDFTRLQHF